MDRSDDNTHASCQITPCEGRQARAFATCAKPSKAGAKKSPPASTFKGSMAPLGPTSSTTTNEIWQALPRSVNRPDPNLYLQSALVSPENHTTTYGPQQPQTRTLMASSMCRASCALMRTKSSSWSMLWKSPGRG